MITTPEIVIRGGTVIDGTGGPARNADVAVVGDRIIAIGALESVEANETIDALSLIHI